MKSKVILLSIFAILVFAGASSAQTDVLVIEGVPFASASVTRVPNVNISAFAGQTVRIRFQAADVSTGSRELNEVFVIQSARSIRIGCSPGESFPAAVGVESNLTYSGESGGLMEFEWRTDRLWSGTCRAFSIGMMDGSVRTVKMSFR